MGIVEPVRAQVTIRARLLDASGVDVCDVLNNTHAAGRQGRGAVRSRNVDESFAARVLAVEQLLLDQVIEEVVEYFVYRSKSDFAMERYCF